MSETYIIIFDAELPRVLEDMKNMLQPAPESRIGDWFLYRGHIFIRVYGFTGAPY